LGTTLRLAQAGSAAERQVIRGQIPRPIQKLNLLPIARLPSSTNLTLAIGLPLRNQPALAKLLHDLYDPASPSFHHYLTSEQFRDMFGPTEHDYQSLIRFATANGLTVIGTYPNRMLLDVKASVSDIERTFQVNMRIYQHPTEARTFYAPDVEPSLDLAVPVLHVSGLDNYAVPRPMYHLKPAPTSPTGATPFAGSGPGGEYMGYDFRAAYAPAVALTGSGQSVGLVEFDGYYTNDIAAYVSQAGLPNVPLKTVLLDGFTGTPGGGNIEVALDIDMAMSMAPGLSSVIVYEGEIPDDVLNRMTTDNLAMQLSCSWGWSGDVNANLDQIFQEMAAQGQSFFNASGDGDAYPPGDIPFQPAEDPYITVVGGTTLTTTGPAGAWVSETVWNWDIEYAPYDDGIGSSGGICPDYAIPSWQQGINMTANQGSTTNRNIPDVALIADNVYLVYDNGYSGSVGGTSCATPLWAGFIALVNQQAVANGQPTVGFLNPAFYAIGKTASYSNCFHDITTGNNTWSESTNRFYAVPGYDLCTGWGSPAGSNLVNALAPLDALQISPPTGFVSSGGIGGPFAPASLNYALTNGGSTSLNWSAACSASWLSISPTSGALNPGGPAAVVTATLNAATTNLFLGTYGATVGFTNLSDGVVQSRQFTLSIIKPPVITAQPTNQAVLGGATTTFAATAGGGLPLLYQWLFNGTNLTDGGNISGSRTNLTEAGNIYGSATSILTISNATSGNVGTYSLVVSNAAGVASSSSAGLAIIPSAPVITQQPASQEVFGGATARLSVAALGNAPIFYHWYDNGTNLTDGGNISGSATPTLTISNVSAAAIGTYWAVVSNAVGAVTSTGAVLTVDVIQPGVQLIQNGGFETGNFSSWTEAGNFTDCSVGSSSIAVHSGNYGALLGPAGSLGYLSQTLPTLPGHLYLLSLWLDSPDGLAPNEFLVAWNGTSLFDQTKMAAFGWTNLQFYVTATGSNTAVQFGFRDDQSFLGLDDVSVQPVVSADGPPVIVTQPASQVALVSNTVAFGVQAFGKLPLLYQWQFNATNIANATNPTLTLTNLATNQAGNYSVIVSNSLGSITSSNAVLTVLNGKPVLVTFDDLPGSDLLVPNGYNSLNWSNFYYLDAATYPGPSGYGAGMVSPPNVAFNGYGLPAAISSTTSVDMLSAYLTAAWNDNLRVEAKGYAGTNLIYDSTYVLSATAPTLINFDYLGVTTVQFNSSGGTPHPGYGGAGTQFVMDNLTVVFPPPPPPSTQATNLLAHWTFDEGTGSVAYDSSGNGNTGTVVNGYWTSGMVGSALFFDGGFGGPPAQVTVSNSASLNPVNGITLAAWVNDQSGGWYNTPRIIEKGASDNQYALLAHNTNNSLASLEFLLTGVSNGTLTVTAPSSYAWHHLAATYDGSSLMSLYIDGQLATQQLASGAMPIVTDPLAIGNKPGSSSPLNFFMGDIDDVRIYGSALAPSQIAALYNIDSVGDGIPNWWRLLYFGSSSATNNASCATCDADGTGQNNHFKFVADLSPLDSTRFTVQIATSNQWINLTFWPAYPNSNLTYTAQSSTDLVHYSSITNSGLAVSGITNTITDFSPWPTNEFYRIQITNPNAPP
jgi:hypothetical protein